MLWRDVISVLKVVIRVETRLRPLPHESSSSEGRDGDIWDGSPLDTSEGAIIAHIKMEQSIETTPIC